MYQEPGAREDQTCSAGQIGSIGGDENGRNGPSGQGSNRPLALAHRPINSAQAVCLHPEGQCLNQRIDHIDQTLTDVSGVMQRSPFDGTGGLFANMASAPITTLPSPPEISLPQQALTNTHVQRSSYYPLWGTSDPSVTPQVSTLNVAATSGMGRPGDFTAPFLVQSQVCVEPGNTTYLPRNGAISLSTTLSDLALIVKGKSINACFDSGCEICFLETRAASELGVNIRPIPQQRQAVWLTSFGVVSPEKYTTFTCDIPALGAYGLAMKVQLIDRDSPGPQIYLGRKLLARLSSQGGAGALHQANDGVVPAQGRWVNHVTPCSRSDSVVGDAPPIGGVSTRGNDIWQGSVPDENSSRYLTIPSPAPWTPTSAPTNSFSAGGLTLPSSVTTLSGQALGISSEYSWVSTDGSCLDSGFVTSATRLSDFGSADGERREEGSRDF